MLLELTSPVRAGLDQVVDRMMDKSVFIHCAIIPDGGSEVFDLQSPPGRSTFALRQFHFPGTIARYSRRQRTRRRAGDTEHRWVPLCRFVLVGPVKVHLEHEHQHDSA